jgi:hypothetical protein
MTPPIDLDRFRISGDHRVSASRPRTLPRHRTGEKFLMGPIPLEWLLQAAHLPGRALHVGLGLWHQAGLVGNSQVALSMKLMRSMGAERCAVYRALQALENAELVAVVRQRGRQPQVTILDAPRLDTTRRRGD